MSEFGSTSVPPQNPAPYNVVTQDQRRVWANSGKRSIGFGVVWFVAGLLITIISYQAAVGGGIYFVAWGPMVYGLIRIGRGIYLLNKAQQ